MTTSTKLESLMQETSARLPREFEGELLARLRLAERRRARARLAIFGAGTLLSVGTLIPALAFFSSEAIHSGFSSYASLLLSDGATVLSFWKEYLLTLAESLPLAALLAISTTLFFSLFFGRLAARDATRAFAST